MSVDRKYTPGGTYQTAGDYEDDHSIMSRAGRLVKMRRGKWLGGRGRQVGSRLDELTKADENTGAEAERIFAEAFAPLLEAGEMTGLEVSPEFFAGRDDVLLNGVDFTDNTSRDSLTHERTSGRKG